MPVITLTTRLLFGPNTGASTSEASYGGDGAEAGAGLSALPPGAFAAPLRRPSSPSHTPRVSGGATTPRHAAPHSLSPHSLSPTGPAPAHPAAPAHPQPKHGHAGRVALSHRDKSFHPHGPMTGAEAAGYEAEAARKREAFAKSWNARENPFAPAGAAPHAPHAGRVALGHRDRAAAPSVADWSPHMDRRGIVPHQEFHRALVRRGFSPKDAAAITGNMMHESGGNQLPGHPVVLNPPTGGDSGDAAWGAGQWEGKRKQGLRNPSLDAQVDHIWNEMHGREAKAYRAMQRARTVSQKAHIVNTLFERPKAPRRSDAERRRLAEEAYRNHLAGRGPGATPAAVTDGGTPKATAGGTTPPANDVPPIAGK
jgi:hypothetical protein